MEKTATQQFIEDAIKGGWIEDNDVTRQHLLTTFTQQPHRPLLDPIAWQAVGKVRGWFSSHDIVPTHDDESELCWCKPAIHNVDGNEMIVHQDRTTQGAMHRFIDHLFSGKTIEEALQAIH